MCRAIQRPDLSQIGRDIQTQNPQVKSTCGRIMVESLETEYPEGIQNTEAGAVLLSARSSSTDVWPSSASKIMPSHFSPVHPGVDQQEHKSVGSEHLLSAAFSRRNLSCQNVPNMFIFASTLCTSLYGSTRSLRWTFRHEET